MKVLGLSSNYHDASAAIVVDGKVAASAAEERFTLQKHDPSFPILAARFCLEQAGLKADDLDLIAYHEEPEAKFSRALASSMDRFPFSFPTFVKSMREAITSGFWVKNEISKRLDVHPNKIVFMPHHMSHAAHSFLCSPFERAAIMTVDAAGEWICSGVFTGDRSRGRSAVEPLSVVPFPHSLGLVYSSFTGFLGFKVNDGECSTMALAAFGKPRYADAVRKIIRPNADGAYEIELGYFDFSRDDALPITKRFTDLFGQPRPYKNKLPFDCFTDGQGEIDPENQRYADIAASIQYVLEESILRMAESVKKRTGERDLCLSGGVALNCVAVNRLMEAGIFENVFVPPDPGDGGGALGAALYASLVAGGQHSRPGRYHPYHGKSESEDDVLALLPHLDLPRKFRVAVQKNFEDAVTKAAGALADGKIVGWVQGRFEAGPRALGNRSILMDPARIDQARRLSTKVKKRAAFRPYACSVAAEEVTKIFSEVKSSGSDAARWMQVSCRVRPEAKAALRAAMHVDGTTRPHVCFEQDNPRMHRLLREFGKRKGRAALLNTSMNERGLPMVGGPLEALLMFVRTDMDMLVINDTVLVKEAPGAKA